MKLIFLGLFFCEESLQEAYCASKRVLMAPHKYQRNLLDGLENCKNVEFFTVNIPPTGSFPVNYKKLFSKRYKWAENGLQIGYLNLPVIKHWIQKWKLKRLLKNKIDKNEETHIVIYSLYEPYLKVVNKLKKRYSKLSVTLIQTDPVPGRGDFEKFMTPKVIKRGNRLVALTKNFDKFILLTKYLAESLEVGDRPVEIMECIANGSQIAGKRNETSKNVCLYAGGVGKDFGLIELADAFALLPEAELWVCGGGNASDYLQEMSQKYSNIKYFGFVKAERVAELQNECDFLINPRRPNGGFTKYSFPSKTVEYMMTGKPVIMYKLEGVPDEYDEYLNYVTGETGGELAEELRKIFSQDYTCLAEKGEKARVFVAENKNGTIQAERLITFLQEARNERD
ncbi:MAG: glycosyltransferase [Clostridia bacterium]|nr:glycosyltransferase [Clostridia bacterium]